MTDNSKKVSELPTAANVALTDRVMVLRDPTGTPSVRTITVANLAIGFPSANTTSAGVIKVGNNLSVNATGFLSTNVASDKGVYPLTYINTASYNVASTDVILLVDPNSLDANVRIVLPTSKCWSKKAGQIGIQVKRESLDYNFQNLKCCRMCLKILLKN